jgi:hypothetical protein
MYRIPSGPNKWTPQPASRPPYSHILDSKSFLHPGTSVFHQSSSSPSGIICRRCTTDPDLGKVARTWNSAWSAGIFASLRQRVSRAGSMHRKDTGGGTQSTPKSPVHAKRAGWKSTSPLHMLGDVASKEWLEQSQPTYIHMVKVQFQPAGWMKPRFCRVIQEILWDGLAHVPTYQDRGHRGELEHPFRDRTPGGPHQREITQA